jgi:hypothetical protein
MQSWFIYYQVPGADMAAVAARVRRMQARLAAVSGTQGRLLQRADEGGPTVTLMEVYEALPEPELFAQQLAAGLAQADLGDALCAARHTERFVTLAPETT